MLQYQICVKRRDLSSRCSKEDNIDWKKLIRVTSILLYSVNCKCIFSLFFYYVIFCSIAWSQNYSILPKDGTAVSLDIRQKTILKRTDYVPMLLLISNISGNTASEKVDFSIVHHFSNIKVYSISQNVLAPKCIINNYRGDNLAVTNISKNAKSKILIQLFSILSPPEFEVGKDGSEIQLKQGKATGSYIRDGYYQLKLHSPTNPCRIVVFVDNKYTIYNINSVENVITNNEIHTTNNLVTISEYWSDVWLYIINVSKTKSDSVKITLTNLSFP
ncbi:MAG: hypothetical protein ACEPOZ_15140 [Marinifilaceae bacterium]